MKEEILGKSVIKDKLIKLEETVSLGELANDTDPNTMRMNEMGPTVPIQDAVSQSLSAAYPDIRLTITGAKRVRTFLQNMRLGGASGVLLICAGDRCKFNAACPLYKEKAHPEGQVCPLEAMVVMDMRNDLSSMVDLDSKNPLIRGYVGELSQIASLTWRCQMSLAYDYHDILQQVPAAVTPEGLVHTKPEASPILEILDRLSARRSRILKELALTEDAKWRREAALGEQKADSLSRAQAARKQAIQSVQGILPSAIAPPSHVVIPGATLTPDIKVSGSEK